MQTLNYRLRSWRVLYSMYLDRLAAVALVLISVRVIKTSTCCSWFELYKCVRVNKDNLQFHLQETKQFLFQLIGLSFTYVIQVNVTYPLFVTNLQFSLHSKMFFFF